MKKDGLPAIVLACLLTVLLAGSIGSMLWLHADNAWLRPIPPYTVFVARLDGVTEESNEFQALSKAMAIFFQRPQGFEPEDHTIDSQRWPKMCAWYGIIGNPRKGAQLESEVRRFKKAIDSELSSNGSPLPWRFALVLPDGRVVYAE